MSDPAITKINGYAPEELTSESLELFYANLNEYDHQGSGRFNPDAFKSNIPCKVYYKRKNGDIFLNEYLGTHFTDTDGNMIAYIMVSRDITERKRAEQALQNVHGELDIKVIERIEELEQALDLAEETTRLKSQIVATMSHELPTLQTSILRSLCLVTQGITGKISQKAKDFLEMARRNSEQLATIVNDILDIERLESRKQSPHLIPLIVKQLLKLAIKMNSVLAEEHDVEMIE